MQANQIQENLDLIPLKPQFRILLFLTDFLDHETDLKNIF